MPNMYVPDDIVDIIKQQQSLLEESGTRSPTLAQALWDILDKDKVAVLRRREKQPKQATR